MFAGSDHHAPNNNFGTENESYQVRNVGFFIDSFFLIQLAVPNLMTLGQTITFIQADTTNRLPFADKQFDISIASYVAHGMEQKKRFALYHEMSRVTGSRVIIHDYNANRNPFTSLIEYLERGDYFHFIKHAQTEMQECTNELRRCFSQVEVLQVGKRANWYICTPNPKPTDTDPSQA